MQDVIMADQKHFTFEWLSGIHSLLAFTVLWILLVANSKQISPTTHNPEALFWHLASDTFDAVGFEAKQKKGVGNLTHWAKLSSFFLL